VNIAPSPAAESDTAGSGRWWRGYLFLFDRPKAPAWSSVQGYQLLAIFLALEFVVRPLLKGGAGRLKIATHPDWLLLEMVLVTVLAVGLVVGFAKVPLSQLGLYRWLRWSGTEKLYFLQIIPITIIVFFFTASTELKVLWTHPQLWRLDLVVFAQQMIWGFYQEFLYRGLLQTELIRRWGVVTGLLIGNLIFTFGPLHAYHFGLARTHPTHLWIFAGIFAIGLFFAVLFQRSGNLAMVAILHGVGDWFIDGLNQISRIAG
jgi:membrane protease YdiL (CAAX protease family)